MALQSSGAISLSDIQTEFGGSNPISLSEYYRGGSYVTDNNTSVPTSGTITMSNFYGAVKQFSHTITSSVQQANLSTILTAAGWNGSDPVDLTINSGVYLWSDSTSVGGLTISSALSGLLTITNYGYIIGKGGRGGYIGNVPTAGGPALVNSATGVTFTNASGAFIAGGGGGGGYGASPNAYGGGGGGAGGGAGGLGYNGDFTSLSGGAGGSIGNEGSDGQAGWGGVNIEGNGGGSGGSGGGTRDTSSVYSQGAGGGGGGRILPGVGGEATSSGVGGSGQAGSAGGSAGNAGTNTTAAGAGGGGWGAKGGNSEYQTGASGGAAISGTAIASMTNNGTIYGSQA